MEIDYVKSNDSAGTDSVEDRFRAYFDHAPDSIFVVDETGEITVCNDRVKDMFGYEPETLLGESVDVLVPDGVRERHPDYRTEYFENPTPRPMGLGTKLEAKRKDGSLFPVDISLNPIDVTGRMEAIAVVRDISDRENLERNVSRYRAAFEKAFDAMVIADDDGRFIDANRSACDMFGLDRDALLGQRIPDFAPDDYDFEKAWREFHASEKERGLFPLVTASGEHRLVEFAATPNIVQNEHLSVLRDVTEREERNTQLVVLDNVLRHNLRNNMTIIQGFAKLAREMIDDEAEWMIDRILETNDELLARIDTAHEIAKILSDPPDRKRVDLSPVLRRIQTRVNERHPEAGITATIPDVAVVNATSELELAIEELLENAVEFTDVPRAEIEVCIEKTSSSIDIHVKDTGPGIPTMEVEMLTGKKEISPVYHGSGFGLWFVHLVVRQSNGQLSFEENEPSGSIVTIRLPKIEPREK